MPDLKPVEQMDAEELRVEVAERRGLSCATYMADGQILVVGCPDWPRDLNAAWLLMDEMILSGECGRTDEVTGRVSLGYGGLSVRGPEKYALEICRAWLTWKRGQEGEG